MSDPAFEPELERQQSPSTHAFERQKAPASEPHRILVIEDDPDLRRGWKLILKHEGYDVMTASDGHAALGLLRVGNPHAVLLDLGLPKLHGLELLKLCASMPEPPAIAVITASADEGLADEAQALGASAVLQKPVHPLTIMPLIDRLLKSSGKP